MNTAAGATFAGYRVERTLGTGPMGTVYSARHPRLPRQDALKILSERYCDAGFRTRFLSAADAAARLHHPNLATVRDFGEFDGRLWIATQYVEGVDAGVLIERGPVALDVARAVRIVAEAARGLDEIHRAGLLHGDVKPSNILVAEPRGEPDRVLLTDFGITYATKDSVDSAYAAPELFTGTDLDGRADVYALGCTLFHLLTGSVPYPDGATAHDSPPRPSLMNPRVPTELDAVIARALDPDPARRYPSCGALAEAGLDAVAELLAPQARSVPAVAGPPRRIGVLAGVAALAVVLVAVVVSLVVWFGRAGATAVAPIATAGIPAPEVSAGWGQHAFMVQAFSELLPYSPDGIGYRELAFCRAFDDHHQSVPLRQSFERGVLECSGGDDPSVVLTVTCNADRTPITPAATTDRVEGDERWTRPSGSGYLRWSNYTTAAGREWGRLEVYFDKPNRNFCKLSVASGAATGSGLRSGWWPDAPL
ncbi:serine/threonine-protein kinase [Nocardia arthritidis]|uniref:non-specific serine/threonine protein kinase n=1 Tax=Nocardia arthritidis TaxID=228602 RepID=A0A6G9YAZ4_9NOCA|nr:serine/threonine-protein kinase [Nocardia arthritidis]QIS10382.1 protein kinase [Nocardia arthritidis]